MLCYKASCVCLASHNSMTHWLSQTNAFVTCLPSLVTGYSLPLGGFLYRRPKGKLRLLTDFSTSFDDVWVESLETRVVLPEGAQNIKPTVSAAAPFAGDSMAVCFQQRLVQLCHLVWEDQLMGRGADCWSWNR